MLTPTRQRVFDPMTFLWDQYDRTPRSHAYTAKTPEEHVKWEQELREKVVELLGGFPTEDMPLVPEIVEEREFPDYIRQRVVFESRPNMSIPAYLLLPKNTTGKIPAIVCLSGHGPGNHTIVGYDDDGNPRDELGGYQMDFPIQAVRKGYAALAMEQLAFGERNSDDDRCKGCNTPSVDALMLGMTMIGLRVWDTRKGLDYLSSRDEIDADRLGVMGISGGGTSTLWTAAVDTRVKAAMVSGYLCTFRDSIMPMSHCVDNYVPGILKYAEMYDLASLIAPRALFAESGTKDGIFPYKASIHAYEQAKRAWDTLGVPDKIGHEVFEGEHSFYGKGGFDFLEKWL
jgi:dienelactone hydrolase